MFRPMMTAAQKKEREKRDKKYGMEESVPCIWPQSISFNDEQLPEVKKWKVGKEYQINLKVRMVSFEDRKKEKNKDYVEGRFEIIAVEGKDSNLTSMQKKMVKDMTGEFGKGDE